MQKSCILFLVFLTWARLTAQPVPQQLLTVVPPSPTVASLGKYGDVPVSLYTGVPDISIPLYDVQSGGISLPITLSYHAGGVKVEEIASSVGLGWTLNAGGIIGRNVRGLPDETGPWFQSSPDKSVENIMTRFNQADIRQLATAVERGERDGEADMYYYNVNQFSGKFFFDQQGGVHTVPAKNLRIRPAGRGWQITMEDGTVYTFDKVEEVNSASCSGDGIVDAAWFLSGIKSADGRKSIDFMYAPINYTYETLLGQTRYFAVNGAGGGCLTDPPPCLGTQHYNTQRLVRINFDGGFIAFNYNTARCDLMGDKSLDGIDIFNARQQLVKSFRLQYAYFGNDTACSFLNKNAKRLKLLSVTEESGKLQKPPYLFTYNESILLPDRLSYAQDHWGYYNGQLSNPGLIATFTTTAISGGRITYAGANRNANPATAQAGVLTAIQYPTGGRSSFSYESNTVSDELVEPQVEYDVQGMYLSASNERIYASPSPLESNELVIPKDGAKIAFHISGLPATVWPDCDYVQCVIIKDNNRVPFQVIGSTWDGTTADWPAGRYKIQLTTSCTMDARVSFSIAVIANVVVNKPPVAVRPVGGLRIRQIDDEPGNGGAHVIKKYRYTNEKDEGHSSGVLINFPDYGYDLSVRVIERDDTGSPLGASLNCMYRVRQSFSNYPLATTQGSYVGYSQVIEDLGDNGESWYTFDAHADAKSLFPFAAMDNADWSRGFLWRQRDFARKNGALVIAREIINTPYSFNTHAVYGIKTGQDYYYIDNKEMPPYLQQVPKYAFYATRSEAFVLRQAKEKLYDQEDPARFIETVTDYAYSVKHQQLVQSKTKTGNLNDSTIEETVITKKYPMDYAFTGSPTGADAMGIKNLQDLHMVSTVVEEFVSKQQCDLTNNQVSKQRVISGRINTFKNDQPYPDQAFTLNIASPVPLENYGNGSGVVNNDFVKNTDPVLQAVYKPEVVFNSYDEKGNITTQQKANDVKKTYIWGYEHKYAVAEIIGADYETVIANSGLNQRVLQNPATTDEEMRTELNKIRIAFPAAMVTTFTYKMLVGITSQSDVNNRISYYQYDALGRLALVRDHEKNILKTHCYNYQGQPESCVMDVEEP